MLRYLHIQNIVLIDSLEMDLTRGLTCLTGETGAGKSILLDSLDLVLGGRASPALIRSGESRASVTAEFDSLPELIPLLEESGISPEGESIRLKRLLTADGKSRAFINDEPVGASVLKSVGEGLVELHGQFDHHSLLHEKNHLSILDAFGNYHTLLQDVNGSFVNWQSLKNRREALENAQSDQAARSEYLRHQIDQLTSLNPKPGEESTLKSRRQVLMNAEKTAEIFSQVFSTLEDEQGAVHQVNQALSLLTRARLDIFDPVLNHLDTARVEMEEAVRLLDTLRAESESDPGELSQVDERLFKLQDLSRRYKVNADELPLQLDTFKRELESLNQGDITLTHLLKEEHAARDKYFLTAGILSQARQQASNNLSEAINSELFPLRFSGAEFQVDISPLPESQASSRGMDRVIFSARTNAGMAFGPLAKIASGGELSRFMLAVKVVLAATSKVPTLIFDEVDAGVSGATAEAVGERLSRLGKTHQVLVVTHSPQVAAKADFHLRVLKQTENGKTFTTLQMLNDSERREEIARLLSGARITDAARETARELMAGVA